MAFGTAVATFFSSDAQHFAGPRDSFGPVQHTGIYLGYVKSGMFLLEQYTGLKKTTGHPHERLYPWLAPGVSAPYAGGRTANRPDEHSGANYYAIMH